MSLRACTGVQTATEGDSLPSPRTVYSERLREDIATLRKRGLVPLAIADILGVTDNTVYRHLRALNLEVPGFLERSGPEREIVCCPRCGEVVE